jgi:hypothetical protein
MLLELLLIVSFCLSAVVASPANASALDPCGITPIEPALNPDVLVDAAREHSWPWMAAICGPTGKL